jgi:hypothetical protein
VWERAQAIGEHGGMVAQTVPPSSRRHSDRLSVTTQYDADLSFPMGTTVSDRKQDVDFLKSMSPAFRRALVEDLGMILGREKRRDCG